MKRIVSLFLSFVMLISIVASVDLSAYAQTYSGTCGDNVTWSLDTDTGILTISGKGNMNNYSNISSTPWNNQSSKIKTVNIKLGITNIGEWAFYSCENLINITIPNSVTSIENWAFSHCNSLTNITIPNSVTNIGDNSFAFCPELKSVSIPNTVTSIGELAFCACLKLTSITVDSNNKNYSSQDGILFNKDKTKIIQYPAGNERNSYTIPSSVNCIDYASFYGSINLIDIAIPNSVTIINSLAFTLSNIKSIKIPNSVTSIGFGAFAECTNLVSISVDSSNQNYSSQDGVLFNKNKSELIQYPIGNTRTSYTIHNGVTSIDDFAFADCIYLSNITISNRITSISAGAFERCTGLISVTIGNSVTSIGEYAFSECTSLTSVVMPNSITTIKWDAFGYCEKLTHVYYSGTKEQWNKIDIDENNDCLINANIHYISEEKKFTLGRDNNSFIHSNENQNCGFYGVTNYQIKDDYMRAKLINMALSNGELASILDSMNSEWNGSCYGIAETIGMNYLGYSSIDEISTYPADNFYSLKKPYQNPKLLDTINYYYLTQLLKNYGRKSKDCVMTLYGWSGWLNGAPQKLSTYTNSDFYQLLINAVAENYTVLLGYGEENGSGHAIITCGIEQISDNVYRIKLYDENDTDKFGYLTITNNNGKYSAVSTYTYVYQQDNKYIDSKEDILNHLHYMFYLPLNTLSNATPYNLLRSNSISSYSQSNDDTMEVIVDIGKEFSMNFENGKYLSYDGNKFDSNIEIYDMRFVANDKNSQIILEVEKLNNIDYLSADDTNVAVYDDESYCSLSGTNIESANINLGNGITLTGTDYSFTATVNRVNSSNVDIVKVNGVANDEVAVKTDANNNVIVTSDKTINDVSVESFSQDSSETILENSDIKELVADENNHAIVNTEHQHHYATTVTLPTCTTQGFTRYTCSCGDSYIDNYVNALGHNFGNNSPTCSICGIANPNYAAPQPTQPTAPIQPSVTIPTEQAPAGAKKVNGEWVTKKQKNAKIKKLTKAKKSFKASWKKVSGVAGYQIQYSTSKKFTKKTTKSVTIKKSKTTSKMVKKLKAKKKYYVRIRTYKNVKLNGKTVKVYSSWSKAKTVKTK